MEARFRTVLKKDALVQRGEYVCVCARERENVTVGTQPMFN